MISAQSGRWNAVASGWLRTYRSQRSSPRGSTSTRRADVADACRTVSMGSGSASERRFCSPAALLPTVRRMDHPRRPVLPLAAELGPRLSAPVPAETDSTPTVERHDAVAPLADEWDALATRVGAAPFL